MLANTAQGLYNQRLAAPNCPVLDAWGILYIQTTRVLLGAWQRPRIRRRALRALPLHPRTTCMKGASRREIPLVELAIIVRVRQEPPLGGDSLNRNLAVL